MNTVEFRRTRTDYDPAVDASVETTEYLQIVRFPSASYCAELETETPYGVQLTSAPGGHGQLLAVCDLDGETFEPHSWELADADEVPPEVIELVATSWAGGSDEFARYSQEAA